ncbi:hypothetical protein CMO92_02495 [Candidatus Woesearchaeota archaeon]|nr:hypothetical protein [Candidatus Woesearchaeota archaeon]
MKAAIISLESVSSQWTAKALKRYFEDVDVLNLKDVEITISGKTAEVLHKGEPLKKYDCIYAKGSFRYAPILTSMSTILHKSCFMPNKPEAFTIAHDKLLTHLQLQNENIPMPRTYLTSTIEGARILLKKVNFPIIMKFPQGTQGKGVLVADSYASASSMLDALVALRQPFILQEYIDTDKTDLRAIVVGDKVVASMKRKAGEGEERANVHQGGSVEPVQLDEYSKQIAIKTAQAIHSEICGVDILESAKGPLVIEANISPGLQGITDATKIDVADKIAAHLFHQTKLFVEGKNKKKSSQIMAELETEQHKLITTVDFRGTRILLPEIATKISAIRANDDIEISIDKEHIDVKKFK